MKVLTLLFKTFFVTFLAFVVQAAIYYVTIEYLFEYVAIILLASLLISVSVFFYIIYKKETPEFKFPWILLIFIMPFFGITLYMTFSKNNIPKKSVKKLKSLGKESMKYLDATEEENKKLHDFLGEYAGVDRYLYNAAFQKGYLDSKITYFGAGEEFWIDLLEQLKKAEKFIFFEFFIVDYGKMWDSIHEILVEKAAAGVEVRFLYDDIGTSGKLKPSFYKSLRKEGIDCHKFNPFRPIFSGIYNNRDHRKIVIIDGKVSYTGGTNIADEYVNEKMRFGHWKDNTIKIEGPAVRNLTALFLQLFDIASNGVSDYEKYLTAPCDTFEGEGYVHPFGDGPKPYYKEYVGENNFINMINASKNYCYITTPYLIPDYHLIMTLRNASMRGVDVRLITPHIPDKKMIFRLTRYNYAYLMEAGVKIFEYTPGFLHSKSLIADDEIAFVGTINLDYRSFVHHYECGAVIVKSPCIKDIKADYDDLFAVSTEITKKNYVTHWYGRILDSIMNIFSPLF